MQDEEQRYLYSAEGGQGNKSVFAGNAANILGGNDTFNKSNFGANSTGFNKTAKTIGHIRNNQVNYQPEHTFFSSATHMFPKAQQVRPQVLNDIDIDLLGTKPSKWNGSVAQPKSLQDQTGVSENHKKFLIRTGFFDETITKSDPQTTYAGTDTRDVYYHGWDISNECTPPRDKERQYQMERTFLMNKTSRVAASLTANPSNETTKYGISSVKYLNPQEISSKMNDKIRSDKVADQQLWD